MAVAEYGSTYDGVFMWEKLYYDLFLINLKDYNNIDIDLEINVLLLFIFLALCVCFFVINHHRATIQLIVKQLVRHNATDEKGAKTLEELGLDGSISVKWMLRSGGQISKLVGRVGEKTYTYEQYKELMKQRGGAPKENVDFTTAKLYVREGAKERISFIVDTYGSSVLRTALYCVLILALYVCIALCMPEILSFVNNQLGNLLK